MLSIRCILKIISILTVFLTFSSCNLLEEKKNSSEIETKSVSKDVSQQQQNTIKIPTIEETVSTLCSDEFEGRLTGSKGNIKAGEYIKGIFKSIELEPFTGDDYYIKYTQEVPSTYGGDGSTDKVENVNNIIGVIKGKDSKKAVVISAHYDHIGYQDGKVVRGALDNASGVSALIDIAHILKEESKKKSFDEDIVICAFNGEEEGLSGSRAAVKEIKSAYKNLYNINIDCIGAKAGKSTLALKNKSKISDKLYDAIKNTFKKDGIDFSDRAVKGVGDHLSFERANIPNVFIVQENIEKLVHKPTDTADTLDYNEIEKISKGISNFIETNDGRVFDAN